MKKFKEYIKESSLNRILDHSKKNNLAIISAFRQSNTRKENLSASKKLGSQIRAAGFSFITVEGTYPEVQDDGSTIVTKEKSFVVIGKPNDGGKLKGAIKKLGLQYDQDSILYKPHDDDHGYLIGTSKRDNVDISYGQIIKIGKFTIGGITNIFSRLKGTRRFTFESIYSVYHPGLLLKGYGIANQKGVRLEEIDGEFISENN